MTANGAALELHGLAAAYGDGWALSDVDLAIPAGRLVGVIGPNGSGKSTLLRAILGLVPVRRGTVTLAGVPVEQQRRRIAYVPQRELVDWSFPISAEQVVLMGRYPRIGPVAGANAADDQAVAAALERVGMATLGDRQIGALSGGQQQRVFLARALAQEARIYFMDEPFAGVDAATERAVIQVLRDLDSAGRTVICVHHDLQTVADYFDHVLLLNTRVVAAGPVATTLNAETLHRTYGGRLGPADVPGAR
ncbi:MAG TPA: metal ABC transporter ATP-binding protein, partial [Candidatus Limnocylindrales bacterium]|nr:metal ABC transporter ATP-binding protein [Candidatus Limnocylindrales bacterium]